MVGTDGGAPSKSECKPEKGAFYPIDKLDISHVEVVEELGQHYRVEWFDNGRGMSRREATKICTKRALGLQTYFRRRYR